MLWKTLDCRLYLLSSLRGNFSNIFAPYLADYRAKSSGFADNGTGVKSQLHNDRSSLRAVREPLMNGDSTL